MKNLKDLKKEKYVFTTNERSNITSIMEDLKFIKTKEISEEGYKRICAIDRELRTLKDKYTQRYINLLKQQHMI
tara:strand:- start:4304 stop:4525 length:222 start_codon:yes stop_codon:yes gene_type:complete